MVDHAAQSPLAASAISHTLGALDILARVVMYWPGVGFLKSKVVTSVNSNTSPESPPPVPGSVMPNAVFSSSSDVTPVPPFATGSVPETLAVRLMVFNLPIEPPPNAVQAASADVAPVPPLAIGNVPVTLVVKETLFNLPIVPPPKAVHAADAVVAPVPP